MEAPVLGYTELVLTVFHSAGRYYPVYFDEQDQPSAHTQEEFIKLLRERLQSNDMLSTFQSIIAQSNEAKNSPSKK